MIKLVCYGSKTLHLKEACRSYVGEKRFTTIQILAAKEIDGHKLSDLQVDLHITQGLYNNKIPVAFSSDADMYQTDVILDEKYTLSAGKIGFYLQFNKTEPDSGNKIIGKTNAVFIEISNNLSSDKHNKQNNSFDLGVSTGGSSGANGKDGKDGKDGITYTPSISTEGILTWVNDGGLPNPEPIKIVGANGKDINPIAKTEDMTQPVGVDENGQLWVVPIGGGLTTAQVNALDGMFKKCAFTGDVSAEYEAFKEAFGLTEGGSEPDEPIDPDVVLTSISATYSGGNVVVGTSVSSLTGITVKATYSDGSTKNVTGYTLSGTITEGSNTITVSYGCKTTTFTVVGVAESGGEENTSPFKGVSWTEGLRITNNGSTYDQDGWAVTDYVDISNYNSVSVRNTVKTNANACITYYDESHTIISGGNNYINAESATYQSVYTLEKPEGAIYVRVCVTISDRTPIGIFILTAE